MGDDLDLTNDGERIPPEQMIAELVEAQMVFMSIGEVMQLAKQRVVIELENLSYDELKKKHDLCFIRGVN